MKHLKKYAISLLILALGLLQAPRAEGINTMAPYLSSPIFMTNAVPPNVLIIFDNSGSMNAMAYWEEEVLHDDTSPGEYNIVASSPYDPTKDYYGYFVAGTMGHRVMYTYSSNKFQRDPSGQWEGNFLNWLTMRRVDIARKVLVGGLATSRTGGGNTNLIGEDPVQSGRSYKVRLDGTILEDYTPHDDGDEMYVGIKDGYLYFSTNLVSGPFNVFDFKYSIQVARDSSYADEAFDFKDGNIAGVMQKVGDKANWGLEFFRNGTGNGQNGGYIKNRVGHPTITNLYTNIENEGMQNWTPLAESLYVAMQYFKQQPIDPSLASLYNPGYQINATWDPYNQDGESAHCAKSFVLLFTDGSSTKDLNIPNAYKNYDGDPNDPNTQSPTYSDDGSDYLDDLALYARTNDLRPELEDDQNIELFVVYAFGDDPAARRLLKDASRNGGFIDKNGNKRPDPAVGPAVQNADYDHPDTDGTWSEWWEDKRISDTGDSALPDTYFEAKDGWQLERELINAITKILERANSGTAVSVLATSGEGEGSLYQAFFKPKSSTATEEVYWTGYLQGLWVDAHGNLREDLGDAGVLELSKDPIVEFRYDESEGATTFLRHEVSEANPYGTTDPPSLHPLVELNPLWEAASQLASRSGSSRRIYTFVDSYGFVPFVEDDPEIGTIPGIGQIKDLLKPYLDLADPGATGLYDYLGSDEDHRVPNLINYIRGVDSDTTRNRTLNGNVWKLGDIVHSTPTPVGRPVDNYDIIYGDETYAAYYRVHKNREIAVYTGANDGMLHAFLAGVFQPGASLTGDGAKFTVDNTKYPGLHAGDEIWAYIPENLLPHLKWLADPNYIEGAHVYYVDLKPRIFDVRLYEGATDSAHPLHTTWGALSDDEKSLRPYGWATVLVGGMRFGGGSISVSGDWNYDGNVDPARTFSSSYFAIDITDPKEPVFLWEKTYTGLGFTTSFPAVFKVDEKQIIGTEPNESVQVDKRHWYLLFGSGPTTYEGTSTQNGRIFLVDLATGDAERVFTQSTQPILHTTASLPSKSFMGSPVTVDLSLDYSVNVAYIGESHQAASGDFLGGLYRLQVPVTLDEVNGKPVLLYTTEPDTWVLSQMLKTQSPVTAAPAAAVGTDDSGSSLWIYFGTGRFLSNADKADLSEQYLVGLKDPYYNGLLSDPQRNLILGTEPLAVAPVDSTSTNLFFDTTGVKIYTDDTTSIGGTTFDHLKTEQSFGERYACGWYKLLESGERIINKPSVLGGILLAPSFVPNQDVCGFGGKSYLHALYFETGTAYNSSVLGVEADADAGKDRFQDRIDLGLGISSSLGIHVGREGGARGFIQQSTGTIAQINLNPALQLNSGFTSWQEVR
jgi:type IV pilus assembly protein PilY1